MATRAAGRCRGTVLCVARPAAAGTGTGECWGHPGRKWFGGRILPASKQSGKTLRTRLLDAYAGSGDQEAQLCFAS